MMVTRRKVKKPMVSAEAIATGIDLPIQLEVLLRVFFFSALLAFAARLSFFIPGTTVPVTLQSAAVLLLAATCPPKIALATLSHYIWLGLWGWPVFSMGRSGVGHFFNLTFGYFLGFMLVACLLHRCRFWSWFWQLAAFLLADVVILFSGALFMGFFLGWQGGWQYGFLPFIEVECYKVIVSFVFYRLACCR